MPSYCIAPVLVVDDEEGQRLFIKGALEPIGYEVVTARDGAEALKKAQAQAFRVALVDLKMPKMDGLQTVAALKREQPSLACVLMTAHATEEVSLGSLQHDLVSCLLKPIDLALLRSTVQQAVAGSTEAEAAPARGRRRLTACAGLVGASSAMAAVRRKLDAIIPTVSAVLLVAEPGSRADTVARTMHDRSPRAKSPFVPILCAALRDAALVTFFFGEQWTGRQASWLQRPGGKLKEAQGGTLFLDGLLDLPLALQWQVLQILQAQADLPAPGDRRPPATPSARRWAGGQAGAGSGRPAALDIRVIVSSPPGLEQAVREQRLLDDLHHQLTPLAVTLPPLRQRREDIGGLLEGYLAKWSGVFHRQVNHITVQALEALLNYAWPRNLAELEECVQHLLLAQEGDTVTTDRLPPALQQSAGAVRLGPAVGGDRLALSDAVGQARAQMERQLILDALEQCNWNRTQAAKTLGLSRKGLHNKMKRYAITPPSGASADDDAS